MPALLDPLRENGGLAPADDLERWKLIVTDYLKVPVGGFREFVWWMSFESEEKFEQCSYRSWTHGQMQEVTSR